jgi:hypothetical protein
MHVPTRKIMRLTYTIMSMLTCPPIGHVLLTRDQDFMRLQPDDFHIYADGQRWFARRIPLLNFIAEHASFGFAKCDFLNASESVKAALLDLDRLANLISSYDDFR